METEKSAGEGGLLLKVWFDSVQLRPKSFTVGDVDDAREGVLFLLLFNMLKQFSGDDGRGRIPSEGPDKKEDNPA